MSPATAQRKTGWRTWRFDQMAVMVNDRIDNPSEAGVDHYVGLEHLDADSLTIRRWGVPSDVQATKLRFRAGDIIFGRRRVYQRKLGVPDFDGICSAHAMVLRAKADVVLKDFLPFFMQSDLFMERAKQISVGSLSPTINWKTLAKEAFALPPLEEQRRIAEVLGAADALVRRLGDARSRCEGILLAFSQQVFAAAGWPEEKLGMMLEYSSDGPFGSKIKTEHYSIGGARVIRLNNIGLNRFNSTDEAFLSIDYYQSSLRGYEVKPGDVVVAGLGDDKVPAGRCCVIPDDLGPAVNKADCYCLRPKDKLLPRFLMYFFNSPKGLTQSAAYAQGTTRMRMNLGNIKRMLVPVPPVSEQENVVHTMDSLLSGAEALSEQATAANAIRNDLLAQLLEVSS